MAHPQQMAFVGAVSRLLPEYFSGTKVCEVGSLDINGSVRGFFKACAYVGYDLAAGPGVDLAQEGQLIGEQTGAFDVVLSTECFEHNPFWVETFSNMLRMSKPSGLVLFTCATTGRAEHGTRRSTPADSPLTVGAGWDYYRNLTSEDFTKTFCLPGWFHTFHFYVCPVSCDLYFLGVRRQRTDADLRTRIVTLDKFLLENIRAYRAASYFR